ILVERSFEIIKQVHESGVAMLIVEQNANVSLSIADRGYVLSTGRLVLEGKAADLREDEGLRKAYLGRSPDAMKELLPDTDRWQARGEKVALATVVPPRRSSPRP